MLFVLVIFLLEIYIIKKVTEEKKTFPFDIIPKKLIEINKQTIIIHYDTKRLDYIMCTFMPINILNVDILKKIF